jgi:hypothetical protein
MAPKARLSLASFSALIITIPILQGCPADVAEPPLGEVGTQYLDFLATIEEVDEFYCDCGTKDGDFDSVQECVAFMGGPPVPPILAECVAQTLDEFEEVRDNVECLSSSMGKVLECVETAGCGGDFAACEQQAGFESCPELPYEVDAAVAEACLGYSLPPAFQCAEGTKILPWLECNFASDCPDGSDERADCPNAYACQSGEIISQEWLCDGIADCGAGDDELNCP